MLGVVDQVRRPSDAARQAGARRSAQSASIAAGRRIANAAGISLGSMMTACRRRAWVIAAVAGLAVGCAARLDPVDLADLTRRAQSGDVTVQLELGDRYRDGRGVDSSPAQAAGWYRAALALEAPGALARLACLGSGSFAQRDLLGPSGIFPSHVPRADADGITPPGVIIKPDPRYTGAAMRAAIKGRSTSTP